MIGRLGCRCPRPMPERHGAATTCFKCGHEIRPKPVRRPPKGKRGHNKRA